MENLCFLKQTEGYHRGYAPSGRLITAKMWGAICRQAGLRVRHSDLTYTLRGIARVSDRGVLMIFNDGRKAWVAKQHCFWYDMKAWQIEVKSWAKMLWVK